MYGGGGGCGGGISTHTLRKEGDSKSIQFNQ